MSEEYLSPEELDNLPEIKALAKPGEKVPRGVIWGARKMEPTVEDIMWAKLAGLDLSNAVIERALEVFRQGQQHNLPQEDMVRRRLEGLNRSNRAFDAFRQAWQHNLLYLVVSGSHAYGTATPESDLDLRGVYCPPLHRTLDGFAPVGAIESNSDGVDTVLQPVHCFLSLCGQGNPNVLDWLFAPDDCVLFCSDFFRQHVLAERDRFLTKALYPRLQGYARSQIAKLGQKPNRKTGAKRKADIAEYGYSVKNAMHSIRLLRVGCELFEKGTYNVRRPAAEELLSIRRGGWSLERVREEQEKLLARLDAAVKGSSLPERIDHDVVARWALDCLCSQAFTVFDVPDCFSCRLFVYVDDDGSCLLNDRRISRSMLNKAPEWCYLHKRAVLFRRVSGEGA